MKPPDAPAVRLRDLVKYFLTLGASGFGGPAALIAQMERDLVEARRWISKEEFREAVAVCQSLPGPWRSRWGSSYHTCARVSGEPGPAEVHSSCRTSSSLRPSARCTFVSEIFHLFERFSTASAPR